MCVFAHVQKYHTYTCTHVHAYVYVCANERLNEMSFASLPRQQIERPPCCSLPCACMLVCTNIQMNKVGQQRIYIH